MPIYGEWTPHDATDVVVSTPAGVDLRQTIRTPDGATTDPFNAAVLHDYPGFAYAAYWWPNGAGSWGSRYDPTGFGDAYAVSGTMRVKFPTFIPPQIPDVPDGSWVELALDEHPYSLSFPLLWGYPTREPAEGEVELAAFAAVRVPTVANPTLTTLHHSEVVTWPRVDLGDTPVSTPVGWTRPSLHSTMITIPAEHVPLGGPVFLVTQPPAMYPDGGGFSGGQMSSGGTFSPATWFVGAPTVHWAAFSYRIVTPDPAAGVWRVRQCQSLAGADGWPLRQRQNGGHTGSWPVRQRQSGL